MTRTVIAALLLALPASAPAAVPPAAAAPNLDLQVRCAALFALVASEQDRKVPGSERFPPLSERGKAFFVATGVRLVDERGLTREAIAPLFRREIETLQAEFVDAPDPAAHADREMALCLPLLPPDTPPVLPPPRKG